MKRPGLSLPVLFFLIACAPEPPPPAEPAPAEPDWLQLETGKGCVAAQVACGPGNCAVNLDNACRAPVTCELSIECLCRAQTGEEGPATAKTQHTVPEGDRGGMRAHVVCDRGEVLATLARRVDCF